MDYYELYMASMEKIKELNLALRNSLETFKKIENEKYVNNSRCVSNMRKYASDMASEIEQLHTI